MDVKELLDEDAFDPKKLFDEKNYSTLIINRDGFSKKENNTADLLEHLLEPGITRSETEEIFLQLKEAKAADMLVSAIKKAERPGERALLTCACWETGLDFTGHLLFFVELACSDDFKLAMEALTVVENCEGKVNDEVLAEALNIVGQSKTKHEELLNILKNNIKHRAG